LQRAAAIDHTGASLEPKHDHVPTEAARESARKERNEKKMKKKNDNTKKKKKKNN
jgi:hypothetical protein